MGAKEILDKELTTHNIEIIGKTKSGSRKLKIPSESIEAYRDLIRIKMTPGFWNEFLDKNEVYFIFKLEKGEVKEYILSPENEQEIDNLCAGLNNELPSKSANVYKFISENEFYHDFMMEYYRKMIER